MREHETNDLSLDTLDAVAGGLGRTHFQRAEAPAPMGGYQEVGPAFDPGLLMPQHAPQYAPARIGWSSQAPAAASTVANMFGPQGFLPVAQAPQQVAPRPVAAPAPQPQANPFAQISQGLGVANQAMGLFKNLGGMFGGGQQGASQGAQQGAQGAQQPQGEGDFMGGNEGPGAGTNDFGGGDFGGGDFGGGDFGGF